MRAKYVNINEEEIGLIPDAWGDEFDVYKNPRSMKRMGESLRAISDKEGNLYVVDDNATKFIHYQIADWLKIHGYINTSGHLKYDCKNFLYWERLHGTNTFHLSGTYSKIDLRKPQIRENYEKLARKVKQKNPQYSFISNNPKMFDY